MRVEHSNELAARELARKLDLARQPMLVSESSQLPLFGSRADNRQRRHHVAALQFGERLDEQISALVGDESSDKDESARPRRTIMFNEQVVAIRIANDGRGNR